MEVIAEVPGASTEVKRRLRVAKPPPAVSKSSTLLWGRQVGGWNLFRRCKVICFSYGCVHSMAVLALCSLRLRVLCVFRELFN